MKALFAAGAIGLMTIAVPAQALVATSLTPPEIYELDLSRGPWLWPLASFSGGQLGNVRSVASAEGSYVVRNDPSPFVGTELMLIKSTGATTLARLPAVWRNCHDIELGQDNVLYAGFDSGVFARIWPTTAALTTVSGGINAMTRDFDTGDFLVAGYQTQAGGLVRIDSHTFQQTSIPSTSLTNITGFEFVPWLGQLLVTRGSFGVNLVNTDGSIASTLPRALNAGFANACCVDQVRRRMFVAHSGDGGVVEYASDGRLVRQKFASSYFFSGIDLKMADKVSVQAVTGQRGSACTLRVKFPSSPNRTYCCAISLGYRRGLRFSARNTLNLEVDSLFLLTVCGGLPGFTTNFTGTLDADGKPSSRPRFMIPPLLSPSDVIYVGAVAVNPNFPDSLDVSETSVVKVR